MTDRNYLSYLSRTFDIWQISDIYSEFCISCWNCEENKENYMRNDIKEKICPRQNKSVFIPKMIGQRRSWTGKDSFHYYLAKKKCSFLLFVMFLCSPKIKQIPGRANIPGKTFISMRIYIQFLARTRVRQRGEETSLNIYRPLLYKEILSG